ncbi:MAG TPA: TRAP transporter small permease [Casimicrobiaceae bacterium]|jgi:TRAP-type C4-dicarboxylate transport system permease small subunit|nr:TRAP transporter small permease [Casimicrobiaceae bacterium]
MKSAEAQPVAHDPGFGSFGRALLATTKMTAIAGGLVFVALVVMEIVSIVGRKLFSAPVPGDVEILQMCAAFASATFFAYCHLIGGDIKVDFFTHNVRSQRIALLDAIGSLLVGVFGALLAWRTGAGALVLKEVGETSAILGWPVWVAQALMVPGFLLLGLAGFYLAGHRLRVALSRGEVQTR